MQLSVYQLTAEFRRILLSTRSALSFSPINYLFFLFDTPVPQFHDNYYLERQETWSRLVTNCSSGQIVLFLLCRFMGPFCPFVSVYSAESKRNRTKSYIRFSFLTASSSAVFYRPRSSGGKPTWVMGSGKPAIPPVGWSIGIHLTRK